MDKLTQASPLLSLSVLLSRQTYLLCHNSGPIHYLLAFFVECSIAPLNGMFKRHQRTVIRMISWFFLVNRPVSDAAIS